MIPSKTYSTLPRFAFKISFEPIRVFTVNLNIGKMDMKGFTVPVPGSAK